ncbi:MAG: ClpX C4-type zinc finger protein [bacterium]
MSDNQNKVISLAGAREKDKEKQSDKSNENKEPQVHCSFCGRPNFQVLKMIKGPGVNICSECVMICIQFLILEDRVSSPEVQRVLDQFWQGFRK